MQSFSKMLRTGLAIAVVCYVVQVASAHSDVSAALNYEPVLMAPTAQAPSAESNVGHRGVWNRVHVDSRVNAYVRVYINGVYRGTIAPFGDIYPIVRDCPHDVTTLYAVSTCGRFSWSRSVYSSFENFHWTLYP